MKPWTLICSALIPLLFAVNASAATNRTTRLGQIDSAADSSFIQLLDSSQGDRAIRLPVVPRAAGELGGRSVSDGAPLLPYVQQASLVRLSSPPRQYFDTARLDVAAIPQGDSFKSYLMLGLAAGLIALHLRRKQKSLQHRSLAELPLAEVMYR